MKTTEVSRKPARREATLRDRLRTWFAVAFPDLLKSKGLLRNPGKPVKILGRGKVEKKFVLAVDKVSASAKAAIEKAGGSVEVKV